MSNQTPLIGYICEYYPHHQENRQSYRDANDHVLNCLPESDDFPPLCRSMISTTGSDSTRGSSRGNRLIYLGGYFNHILDGLPQWLDKFESLLRRLYWTEAELQIYGGWMCASYTIEYRISQATADQFAKDPENPARDWICRVYDRSCESSTDNRLEGYLGSDRFSLITSDPDNEAPKKKAQQDAP
jgi:hypothetical protein